MNLAYTHLIDAAFHPQSRIWVYQANRLLSLGEAFETAKKINEFAANWQSHGDTVKAAGHLFFGQFVILMADETQTGVSGCSTDSSVRFIKELEQSLGVNFFDRTSLAFVINDRIQLLPMAQINYALEHQFITPDTLYFNNMVQTKQELEQNWILPVKQSWLAKKLNILSSST